MTAKIIKGSEVAKEIREELAREIADLKAKHNVVPGLVTVLVGADPASQVMLGLRRRPRRRWVSTRRGMTCRRIPPRRS
jgi:methylenetetrahydrofolate dehydrogenase (NADP+)/methenyltetrahydrofolate cyclohydrolase